MAQIMPKLHLAFGGAESPEGDSLYASPAGPYFCSCKSRQNTLGAVPQDPPNAKLRLDTNDALASSVQRRRYALKVPAAHFYVEIVDRVPLPRSGGGGRCACGYLWSASVRSTDLFFPIIEGKTIFVSSTAKRQRGLSRGNSSPLTRFCLLLVVQKEAPAG